MRAETQRSLEPHKHIQSTHTQPQEGRMIAVFTSPYALGSGFVARLDGTTAVICPS